MTVPNELAVWGPFFGNDINNLFPFSGKIFSPSDLVVQTTVLSTGLVIPLVLNTDYTVAPNPNPNLGGNVVTNTPLSSTKSLLIKRILPLTQLTDLKNQGAFHAQIHEDAFDKLAMVDQQLQIRLNEHFPIFSIGQIGYFVRWLTTTKLENIPPPTFTVSGGNFFGLHTGIFNVKDFGAQGLGNPLTDDLPAFQDALAAIPPTGGTVFVPPGIYYLSGPIEIGDGSNAADSTKNNIKIIGCGQSVFDTHATTIIRRIGGDEPGIRVNGPITGVEIANMTLDANNTSHIGLEILSMRGSNVHDLAIVNQLFHGLHLNTRTSNRASNGAFDNSFRNIQIASLAVQGTGLYLHGDGPNFMNATCNVFDNFFIFFHGGPTSFGATLRFTDGNTFNLLHVVGHTFTFTPGGGPCLYLDAVGGIDGFPSGNTFINFTPSAGGTLWNGAIGPNFFLAYDDTNGAAIPPIHVNLSGTTRSGKNFGYLHLLCIVKRNTGQTVPSNTFTTVDFDQTESDTYNMHSNITFPNRIVLPKAGMYRVTASSAFAPNGVGYRSMTIAKNGAGIAWLTDQRPGHATDNIATLSGYLTGIVGDIVELSLYQNSGEPLGITQATLSVEYTGA